MTEVNHGLLRSYEILGMNHMHLKKFARYAQTLATHTYKLLRHIISPPMCAHCKAFLVGRTVFCASCAVLVQPIVSHTLAITATHTVLVFAISDYKDPIRSLILAKGIQNIAAARQIGILLWNMTDLKYQHFDYIIPVPLHWWRYAQRSYNQAAEIAYGMRTQNNIPVLNALQRTRATIRQSELSHDARADNVKEAFVVPLALKKKIRGARVLLVDDLMTTGATLKACTKQLLLCKPASIVVGVASRVV
jgi:ComF family protein